MFLVSSFKLLTANTQDKKTGIRKIENVSQTISKNCFFSSQWKKNRNIIPKNIKAQTLYSYLVQYVRSATIVRKEENKSIDLKAVKL
jgi:hypothetical protein